MSPGSVHSSSDRQFVAVRVPCDVRNIFSITGQMGI